MHVWPSSIAAVLLSGKVLPPAVRYTCETGHSAKDAIALTVAASAVQITQPPAAQTK